MTTKAKLAIVGGVAALVALFAVYALVAGMQGITQEKGITVNEEKRGKGMVETLEFKNPVTIRLIDKDGNVVDEKVVYNAITAQGKAAVYEAFGDGSINPIDGIASTNSAGSPTTGQVFTDTESTPTTIDVSDSVLSCTPNFTSAEVTCTVTFSFATSYTADSDGTTIDLNTSRLLKMGDVDAVTDTVTTPYFEIDTNDFTPLNVAGNTTVTAIQVTWKVTIP